MAQFLYIAFKYRGASNAVALLTEEQAAKGIVTHSSGNHAQAIALAAKNRGIVAHIVMPNTTPEVKKTAVLGYGANVIECEPLQSVREKTVSCQVKNFGNEKILISKTYR